MDESNLKIVSRIDNFVLPNVIGSGSFGNVYKCKNKIDNVNSCALKIISLNGDNCEKIFRESRIMATLNHKNIVKYNTWIDNSYKFPEIKGLEYDSDGSSLYNTT